jgi:hypothetical protein
MTRPHRSSIFEPATRATIHNFAFKVIENCLKYLNPHDLVAPILACRAWYPAAAGLIVTFINLVENDRERVGRFICGLYLHSRIFAYRMFEATSSLLKLLIIPLVSSTLSSLTINFDPSSVLNDWCGAVGITCQFTILNHSFLVG